MTDLLDQKHIGTTLQTRDNLIKCLLNMQQLNSKDVSTLQSTTSVSNTIIYQRKLARNEKLIVWLKALTKAPTMSEKEKIITLLKIKKAKSD